MANESYCRPKYRVKIFLEIRIEEEEEKNLERRRNSEKKKRAGRAVMSKAFFLFFSNFFIRFFFSFFLWQSGECKTNFNWENSYEIKFKEPINKL